MNENINLVKILKDAPKGTKLWSPICGECEVESIIHCDVYPIRTTHGKGNGTRFYNFTSQGKLCNNSEAECLLFPSKDNRDWSTFKAPWKHKVFELGQKVLVPYYNGTIYKWRLTFYSNYEESGEKHITTGNSYLPDEEIIAYEGNEGKLGKPIE